MRKYLLLMFLLVNMTAEYFLLASISKIVFYIVLALSVFVCSGDVKVIRKGLKKCPFFLWWAMLYIGYQFTVGLNTLNLENVIYVIAKIATFSILLCSIAVHYDYYFQKIYTPLGYIIGILLFVGFNYVSYSGVRSYGFFNPNAGCSIALIGASCFLFKDKKLNLVEKFILLFCIFCVVAGHSRNTLAMLLILMMFRYKVSPKFIATALFFMFVIIMVLPVIGFELEAVNRMIGTFDGSISIDRENQREAARWMIEQHPWDGNGFNFVNYGYALSLTELGAHNGYLTTFEQMGCLFASIWFLVLLVCLWRIRKLYSVDDLNVKRHFALIVAVLFAAMNEDLFVGVNSFTTNLFYMSLAILSFYQKRLKHDGQVRVS